MIKLYSFGSNFGVEDPSPFVLKIDCYLRMANIDYQSIPDLNNLKKAPKGKLPFITDGEETIPDSEFIIAFLQEKYQVDLDTHLSETQKSIAYLMRTSLNENLYWCLVYSRWAIDDTWVHIKKAFFDSMPFPLKFVIPPIARRAVISALDKQGLGRHSEEEILTIAKHTFESLSEILGDKTYFFGDSPCTFDATAFGFLSQFISVPLENKFNALAHEHSNLVNYCKNISAKYY